MIMDRELKVVFLNELLISGRNFRCWITRDDDRNPSPLRILELAANIVVIVFGEVYRPDRVELDVGRRIVRERLRFRSRIHWEMIFHVLGI